MQRPWLKRACSVLNQGSYGELRWDHPGKQLLSFFLRMAQSSAVFTEMPEVSEP